MRFEAPHSSRTSLISVAVLLLLTPSPCAARRKRKPNPRLSALQNLDTKE